MRFLFPHSHAFRKGRVTVDDDGQAAPDCLVEFGDGVTVIAEWHAEGDAIRLAVPDYRTARGTLVAKLDDVTIDARWQGRGVGTAMLKALALHLRGLGVTRIDSSCHRDNADAWRFYERLGFRALHEERIALLIA